VDLENPNIESEIVCKTLESEQQLLRAHYDFSKKFAKLEALIQLIKDGQKNREFSQLLLSCQQQFTRAHNKALD